MTTEENIKDLETARDLLAKVYEKEATDNHPDNGNLSNLNNGLLAINNAISELNNKAE